MRYSATEAFACVSSKEACSGTAGGLFELVGVRSVRLVGVVAMPWLVGAAVRRLLVGAVVPVLICSPKLTGRVGLLYIFLICLLRSLEL